MKYLIWIKFPKYVSNGFIFGVNLNEKFVISFVIISGDFLPDNNWDSLYISVFVFVFGEFRVNTPYKFIETYSYINVFILV